MVSPPPPVEPPPPDLEESEASPPPPSGGHLYQAGDIIAQKYRLTRELGKGGMGAVWLARNTKLDVDVAIKLIRHELGTAEASRRLLQEARAAARIGHRSIVRVFDFGETELDDPFIVMEVLSGDSLRQVLDRKGRLPAGNAVRTLLPIASALVEAHASGVVHRDLKPENIMLVPRSAGVLPKLLDFGIAKFRRPDEHPDDQSDGPRLVAGTPDYMSPEQAGGHDAVSEGADVWALAVILYELITGRVPFSGPGYGALVFAIMTAEPVPTHEQLAGDAELWGILHRALAKRDVDRPSMRTFGTALAEWALGRGIDSDLAGTSLSAAWLRDGNVSPFSEAPPPVSDDPSVGELSIPRPAGLPGGYRGLPATEAPPPPDETPPPGPPSPSHPDVSAEVASHARRALWPLAAIAAAGAVILLAGRGRPPPVPHATGAGTGSAAVVPISTAAPVGSASDPSPLSTAAASASGSSTPAADGPASAGSAAAPPATSVATGKPLGKKPPRKGALPIAKQPNF